jgi:hypothetical protein
MRLPSWTRALLAPLLPFLVASTCLAGTVTGTVTNGTTGKPARDVDVILIELQGAMQPVAHTKTDSNGHYELNHPALGSGPMLIRAVYRGVNYHEPATPGKTTVNIEVFEPSEKPDVFSVTARAIVLEPGDSSVVVDEEYLIANTAQPPVAYYRPGGSFEFSIPANAELGEVSVVGTSGMPVKQAPISKRHGVAAIDYPFRPGDTNVRLSYRLAYPNHHTSLQFSSPYRIDRVAIFAPPAVSVSGSGFAPAGQQQGFNVFMKEAVAANTLEAVSVSGTGPMPQAESDATGDAVDDSAQNPSVNSRAESAGPRPVASFTTLPARLDSLRWYVVGGLAALFALGLGYIWWQPRVAVQSAPIDTATLATAATETKPASVRGPVEANDSARSDQRNGGPAAARDRAAQGSLDELKDSLFRLELRRQAGTITEAEYARERDRVQQLLRDLVKG